MKTATSMLWRITYKDNRGIGRSLGVVPGHCASCHLAITADAKALDCSIVPADKVTTLYGCETTYSQFVSAYEALVRKLCSYHPNSIGALEYSGRLADLTDRFPAYEARYDAEQDARFDVHHIHTIA